jgi:asparagine synthase (glutamine-hydrolysing)
MMDEGYAKRAGVFDPQAVRQLYGKCRSHADGQFSNADNMAVVGILSTHVLHEKFVEKRPLDQAPVVVKTVVDRLETEP